MKRYVFFFQLSAVLAFLLGCGIEAAGDRATSFPERKNKTSVTDAVPTTARVVCGGEGVRVLTPEVEARADGVHLSIDNRLGESADLSVSHPGGGMGWSVPTGESKRVANVPPGRVRIDCLGRSWGRDKVFAMNVGKIEVLAGESGYKSTKLDCPRARPKEIEPFTEEEMEERRADPVEIFRRSNSGSLRQGDVVEAAGNTRSRDERTVRVVRDGRVIATAHYLKFSTGWLEATDETCAEF